MSKNTSELWSVVPGFYPGFVEIFGASFKISVVTHAADISLVESMNRIEDAHRIVACVNACRGLPTDELERKGLATAVGTELLAADERAECQEREVRRLASVAANAENQLSDALNQRDQLLAVLEEISNLPSYRQDECSEMARDAIAKAKGIDHE